LAHRFQDTSPALGPQLFRNQLGAGWGLWLCGTGPAWEHESEAQMNSMPIQKQSEFVAASLLVKPSVEAPTVRPASPKNNQLPQGWSRLAKLSPFAFARYLIAFFVGVTATVAWQSYGGAAREMTAPAPDRQQFNAVSLDLDAMRQSIDRVAASVATGQEQITRSVDQLAAGQEQMTRAITKLQAVEQFILYKSPEPPPRPAHALAYKPVPRPALVPAPAPTVR